MDALAALVGRAGDGLEGVLLVFCRVGTALALTPVLGHRAMPVAHRAGLALLVALLLAPVVGGPAAPAREPLALALAVACEVFIGLAMGFVAALVVRAAEGAGDLVATQMGLGLGSVFDPSTGEQDAVLGRFQHLLALVLFVSLNGHHLVLQAVAASFRRFRPGALLSPAEPAGGVVALGGGLVRSGLELAAPVVGLLLAINVALGLLARAAPQANVFLLGLPVTLALGLITFGEALPSLARSVGELTGRLPGDLSTLFAGAGRGLR